MSGDFSGLAHEAEGVGIQFTLTVDALASKTGNRIFFQPNLLNAWSTAPPKLSRRRQTVILNYAFTDRDTIYWQIPTGYKVESLPAAATIETEFASFHSSLETRDREMVFIRRLEFRDNRLEPEMWDAYQDFAARVVAADRAQVVLVKEPVAE